MGLSRAQEQQTQAYSMLSLDQQQKKLRSRQSDLQHLYLDSLKKGINETQLEKFELD